MTDETLVGMALVHVGLGYLEFDSTFYETEKTVRISFEVIEQFYERIKPHLEYRRSTGTIEGEALKLEIKGGDNDKG